MEHVCIFRDEDPVKILLVFLIRDQNDDAPLASLIELFVTDDNSLSSQIYADDADITYHFYFEFVSLSHLLHRAEVFASSVIALGKRFSVWRSPEYLLSPSYLRKVPTEDL